MENPLKINYRLFLEAEDVSQSRIRSCAAYLENVLHGCRNPYISRAQIEDESDLDDFILRLYVEEDVAEECAADTDAAEAFLDEFAGILTELAHAHSFLDMEGSFSISFEGEEIAYEFASGAGEAECRFQEQTEAQD